ncbi:MAG: ABC transporter ATP-binding protein/permease [Myxococcales bacterium]|nr:ABC transporter ATP-binding protein/permease [Myxococcales bacterium]MCB9533987.1 ABC transporter ATP-binding protein/permease [Myxococcales bacterium]
MHGPPTHPATGRIDAATIRTLLPYLGAYRGRTAFAISLLLLAKVATVAVPGILKRLVDTLDVPAGAVAVAAPLGLLLAYGGLRIAGVAFRELQGAVFERVRDGIMRQMSLRVVQHLHDLSLRFHLERKTGELARDIDRGTNSVSTLLNHLLFNIVPTLVEVALVAGLLVANYDVRYALVTVVAVAAYIGSTFAITAWRLKFRMETNRLESEASSRAIDGLLNYETVKYFGNERFELERYDKSLQRWEDAAVKSQVSLSLLNAVQGGTIAIGVTVIMILAARGVAAHELTIGDLVAVNAYMLQLFAPLGFLGTVYSMLKHAVTDMERMFALLQRVPEIQDRPGATPLVVAAGDIRFDDVVFAYDPNRRILHGVSVDIPAGKKVALVGASGSGKSTLARLLFRFYDVDAGRVTIDGVDVRDLTQDSVRAAIGIVPQDTVLFNDTLRFNLRYGRLDATDDEITAAVRAAQLEAFVASLPDGLDTIVGERGLKLSGGEKQRVAIARALLKAPRILIFDEATSSLDSSSEQAILGALRALEGNRTTLVIAHRLSTIVDADEIVVLDAGRVIERGAHSALLAANGPYARLWELQQAERAEAAQ